ncbi:MAG TPA: hypothetical protein PLN52_13735 [Opitutaceae bacterium]|nr:hypothetical protein [Opitutaceae bacterium]
MPPPRLLLLLLLALPFSVSPPAETPQVIRTFMPEATPSSFAVTFANGINICYDPVRGSTRYAWVGPGIDLSPARPGNGKFIKAASLQGTLVYQEDEDAPLRVSLNGQTPEVVFKGYQILPDSVVFYTLVDGVPLSEEIQPRSDGRGIVRRFRRGGHPTTRDRDNPHLRSIEVWYVPGKISKGQLAMRGGDIAGNGYHFTLDEKSRFELDVTFAQTQP